MPGNANAMLVDASGVLLATDQDPHLGNARKMRSVKTADGASSDDENGLQGTYDQIRMLAEDG